MNDAIRAFERLEIELKRAIGNSNNITCERILAAVRNTLRQLRIDNTSEVA